MAPVARQQSVDADLRNRPTKQETLRFRDRPQPFDHPHLSLRFDTLDQHPHAQLAAHRGDALD